MRKYILLLIAALLLGGIVMANAGDITPTGIYQKDLYKFLSETKARLNGLSYILQNKNGTVDDPNLGVSASNYARVNATSAFGYYLPENAPLNNATKYYSRATGADMALTGAAAQNASAGKWAAWYFDVDSGGTMYANAMNASGNGNYASLTAAKNAMSSYSPKSGRTLVGYMFVSNGTSGWNCTGYINSAKYEIVDKHLFDGNSTLSGL